MCVQQKETGILLAVSSLPSPYGIGDLGPAARAWLELLGQNGVTIWQILPLNPTGYGNSPYQPYSSCAGDEMYLSLEELAAQGLLPNLPEAFPLPAGHVDYEAVRRYKEPLLRAAWQAFVPDEDYRDFAARDWVRDYAVFRAFKKENDNRCWLEWPEWQRTWPENRAGDLTPYREEMEYQTFLQYQFARQWQAVRAAAAAKGIRIMGDVPFYVGVDSVDVWAGKENFLLDADGRPAWVAGVPPDYFSATGQRWGNPIYDWGHLQQTGFDFWVRRIGYNKQLFDVIRIDHFRAFDTYWKIPASCPTAMEGDWIEAPGYAVLDTLYRELPGLELVAVSADAGVYAVKTEDSRQFFVMGHPEYDPDTLAKEYWRDVDKGLDIAVPANYFPGDDPTKVPVVRWRSAGQLLYTNWLNYYVYQTTPYDLKDL